MAYKGSQGKPGTLQILKPWVHFNPRNDCNDVFIQYDLPQMDVYTCYVESELVFNTSIQVLVLDNTCVGGKPIVVVQMAEQYNGQYDNQTLEQFRTMKDIEGFDEVVQVVEAKLKELRIDQ